jgi:hypothetical protein
VNESGSRAVSSIKRQTLREIGRTAAAMAVALAAAIAVAGGLAGTSSLARAATIPSHQVTRVAPTHISSHALTLTPAELSQWRQETATPAQRARLVATLRDAFAGVARVGTGTMPTRAGHGSSTASGTDSPELSFGRTGDHFWIIASYADVADGALRSGVLACAASAPEFADVCETAGELLSEWASGWGRASDHGVWAAIYWWPPHVTGGRW